MIYGIAKLKEKSRMQLLIEEKLKRTRNTGIGFTYFNIFISKITIYSINGQKKSINKVTLNDFFSGNNMSFKHAYLS